jgi:hypothetical protein
MNPLNKEPLKVIGRDGKTKVLPGYKQKSIVDHIIILLGVMTAISLFVIMFDLLYEVSFFPYVFFDTTAQALGSSAIDTVYQNDFYDVGWARMMATITIISLVALMTTLFFYYIKDLVFVVRQVMVGASRAARDTGDVLKETATNLNPFNIDPETGETIVRERKKKLAKPTEVKASSSDISLEELDKALTDPNYVPKGIPNESPKKPSLFDDK